MYSILEPGSICTISCLHREVDAGPSSLQPGKTTPRLLAGELLFVEGPMSSYNKWGTLEKWGKSGNERA